MQIILLRNVGPNLTELDTQLRYGNGTQLQGF